jgi:uncharacterized membrane protein SpoIIM required for sporulation
MAGRHCGGEEMAVSLEARRLTNPLVLWSSGALGVFMLGAWVGALGALVAPGVELNPTNSIGSAAAIFQHNLVVLGLISAGAPTLGLTTAGALFLNGGLVGFIGTELLERRQFGMFMTGVAPQLALELGAYVVAAGATLRLGWSIWWPLLSRRKGAGVQWRQWLAVEAVAVVMLFGGAVVEATFSHV